MNAADSNAIVIVNIKSRLCAELNTSLSTKFAHAVLHVRGIHFEHVSKRASISRILILIWRRGPACRPLVAATHACKVLLHGHKHALQRRHIFSELLLLGLQRIHLCRQKLHFLRAAQTALSSSLAYTGRCRGRYRIGEPSGFEQHASPEFLCQIGHDV
jgi:hypothetical protein